MLALMNAGILSRRKISKGNILIEGNKIVRITKGKVNADEIIDCEGKIAAAGYIDIHTHGGYLHDVMEGTRESISEISRYHLETGTTTYLPSTITASTKSLIGAVNNARSFSKENPYSRIFGIHLEGPFFTPENAGAQPPKYLTFPTEENTGYIFKNADFIKRISLAPDAQGMIPYIKRFHDAGIQVSGGHDSAVDYEIYPSIENGMNSVTHIFNCSSMASRRPLPHKYLGLTEIGLIDDRLYVEVIGDNRHTPFPQFELVRKTKPLDKILLVSDSLSVAGMGSIKHYLGKRGEGYEIEVKDGVAILPVLNTYAGSVTPVGRMVQILLEYYHMPIADAICMANLNQAELLNMSDRGDIREGYLADINILDEKGNILQTIFDGKVLKKK